MKNVRYIVSILTLIAINNLEVVGMLPTNSDYTHSPNKNTNSQINKAAQGIYQQNKQNRGSTNIARTIVKTTIDYILYYTTLIFNHHRPITNKAAYDIVSRINSPKNHTYTQDTQQSIELKSKEGSQNAPTAKTKENVKTETRNKDNISLINKTLYLIKNLSNTTITYITQVSYQTPDLVHKLVATATTKNPRNHKATRPRKNRPQQYYKIGTEHKVNTNTRFINRTLRLTKNLYKTAITYISRTLRKTPNLAYHSVKTTTDNTQSTSYNMFDSSSVSDKTQITPNLQLFPPYSITEQSSYSYNMTDDNNGNIELRHKNDIIKIFKPGTSGKDNSCGFRSVTYNPEILQNNDTDDMIRVYWSLELNKAIEAIEAKDPTNKYTNLLVRYLFAQNIIDIPDSYLSKDNEIDKSNIRFQRYHNKKYDNKIYAYDIDVQRATLDIISKSGVQLELNPGGRGDIFCILALLQGVNLKVIADKGLTVSSRNKNGDIIQTIYNKPGDILVDFHPFNGAPTLYILFSYNNHFDRTIVLSDNTVNNTSRPATKEEIEKVSKQIILGKNDIRNTLISHDIISNPLL